MDQVAEQLINRLRQDPSDGDAYAQLKHHYRRSGDMASLANLLEGWAGNNTHDALNASDAYVEAADAVLQSSGDSARAKVLFQQALHLNVGNETAGARLSSMLEEAGEAQELAEFLDQYARALEAAGAMPSAVAPLYQRLGEIWEHQFGREDAAADYYARAQELQGNGAIPAAAPASLPEGDPEELVAGYRARIANERNRDQKLALVSELATLQSGQLADLEGAILTLRQALSEMPGDIQIMHQLATCLLSRTEGMEPEEAAADYRRVAELFYRIAQGVEPEIAIEYLESALGAVPAHDGALALLEEHAETLGRSDLLPQYWVAYLASAAEGPEVDQRRIYLGQAYLASGQLEDALYCLQPVAEHGNDQAHQLLQEVYARQARAPAEAGAPPAAGASDAPPEPAGRRAPPPSALPTTRPPARRSEDELARDAARVSTLRKRVHELVAARRHDEAAEVCREIIEIDPNDPEAFNLLESHYRKRRDYGQLRDLLLASTRIPGLSVDARKLRLREVATLSEAKLRDSDGAVAAWRGVVTLDPADRDATRSLKRLLKKAQQWDELASVLEREALATTDSKDKAGLIREIALIHRDRRKDLPEAAEAFRQLYALRPEDAKLRDELCELFLELEYYEDAVPLLRERADASDDRSKLKILGKLAEILEEKLGDLEGTHAACEQILELKPNDRDTFERLLRVDEKSGDHQLVLATLERRAGVAPNAERPGLLVQMGTLAEEQLYDLDRAAEYYGNALDLAPDHEEALSKLVAMFEGAERYGDLVELLRERCLLEKEPRARVPLQRRIARVLAEQLDDGDAAAEAYRELLAQEEDVEALRFLKEVATRDDDVEELQDLLRRLATVVEDVEEKRDLLFDRSTLLYERLERGPEALVTLRELVEQVSPGFEPAIDLLIEIAESTGDQAALGTALRSRLVADGPPETRLAAAKQLADLLRDDADAADVVREALDAWAQLDERDPEPRRRLRPLLEKAGDWAALVDTLDALGNWEDEFDARDEAVLSAARTAMDRLGDGEGAWNRLVPLVQDGNPEAQSLLEGVAIQSDRTQHLAALYVRLAQESEEAELQGRYWRAAAEIFQRHLEQPGQALEAGLRMLATDLENRDMLAFVDRLAVQAKAWPRLSQVYDRLLRQAESDEDKVALLSRHAELLQEAEPSEALDRVLRACALAPNDRTLLTRAEDLARRTDRSEELLMVYDRRIARADDAEERTRAAVHAARLCDGSLRDRGRANGYLKAALAQTQDQPAQAAIVEEAARELDDEHPEHGSDAAQRALIRAHRDIAERAEPEFAARLMLRAAELLDALEDPQGAFDMLRHGTGLLPTDDRVYEAAAAAAERVHRLDALDAHLMRLVDDAIDSETTVALLRRRGQLLEGVLKRPQDAANVYQKLLQLRPDDGEVAGKLRQSLRSSGRFQDLLLAIAKQLKRTEDDDVRLELLRDVAVTWERDLKNRWEAMDAWKAVLEAAPGDAEADEAIERLEKGRTSVAPEEEGAGGGEQEPVSAASALEADGGEAAEPPETGEAASEAGAFDDSPAPGSAEEGEDTGVHATPAEAEADAEERSWDEEAAADAEASASEAEAEAAEQTPGQAESTEEPEAMSAEAIEADPLTAFGLPEAASDASVDAAADASSSVEEVADASEAAPPAAALAEQPSADAPADEEPADDESGLAALEAGLGGGPEELDLMEGVEEEVQVDMEAEPIRPPSSPGSIPPPLPGRPSRPGSLPPPLPGAASRPPGSLPPAPSRPTGSTPPPLPGRASGGSMPPPLPPSASRPPGSGPPFPPGQARGTASVPPPLPPSASRPPGSLPPAVPGGAPRRPASMPPPLPPGGSRPPSERPRSVPPPLPPSASRPPETSD